MTPMQMNIDRLRIALHGVSEEVAAAAVAGLATELTRRLNGHSLDELRATDIGITDLPPITVNAGVLDAAALRDLIADQLLDFISAGSGMAGDDEIEREEP